MNQQNNNSYFILYAVVALVLGMTLAWRIHRDGAFEFYKKSMELTKSQSLFAGMMVPGHLAKPLSRNEAEFESGNIGKIERRSEQRVVLHLRSDNDESYPHFWRQWWYTKLDNVPRNKMMTIDLRGRGHWNYYLPVYSYDRKTWYQFKESEVTQPHRLMLRFKKAFRSNQVWLARYEPYTYTKNLQFVDSLRGMPHVQIDEVGRSSFGRMIHGIRVEDPTSTQDKKSVFVHARTHPGEVASSFYLEGLVKYFAGSSRQARKLRRSIRLVVVPMLNVDGVVEGNNRVTPTGVNLEGQWNSIPGKEYYLDRSKTPREVLLLHRYFARTIKKFGVPTVALNLHSSNGEPDDRTFFFPHFGHWRRGYNKEEFKLWSQQVNFINAYHRVQGVHWFNPIRPDGGREFIEKDVPESWWWRNYKSKVMALSIESTYGRIPGQKRWTKPADLEKLGESLAKAIAKYHDL